MPAVSDDIARDHEIEVNEYEARRQRDLVRGDMEADYVYRLTVARNAHLNVLAGPLEPMIRLKVEGDLEEIDKELRARGYNTGEE